MLSLRTFARSAPRSIARLATVSRSPAVFGGAIRAAPSVARFTAPFSTSFVRRQGNEELVAKLTSEYEIETSSREEDADSSATIKEYLEDSPFKLIDTPGQEEVILTRKYNDEEIRVTFSIADLANESLQDSYAESDHAMFDEGADLDGSANSKGAINAGGSSGNMRTAPEDRIAPSDEEGYDEDLEPAPAFPARVNVRVTRDGKQGAIMIEATAQDGEIIIDNVYFFKDVAQADPENADAEWKRRSVYAGPPFGNLDEELQILLERYLDERGIDVRMANFIPEFIDYKEQKEYVRWLNNLKNFFE
ncbi:uncharacterized protein PV09_07620 [Verruconis gallopava]|uniref:Mitochondrial glyco protein n=1 Tax=Verruconis gallopava TaxID=253628 RepID=A0A0D2A271_9PEZI|nr:uncharacterized protein PV09_07620 [Verruconis gallopava]KIW00863.1 hypothetical protein PV09_07620 [Verruconis gallopava]